MTYIIHGQQGPYPLLGLSQRLGNFGRNTAYAFEQLCQTWPQTAMNAEISYSPNGYPSAPDAFGYVEEQIRHFDANRSGTLDFNEFRRAMGLDDYVMDRFQRVAPPQMQQWAVQSGQPLAIAYQWAQSQPSVQSFVKQMGGQLQQFFQVLDTNRDGQLDPVENTAYLLFQDNAPNQLLQAVAAFVQGGLMPSQALQNVTQVLRTIQSQFIYPMVDQPDGKISLDESRVSEMAVTQMPTITREILTQFQHTLQLPIRYQRFKLSGN